MRKKALISAYLPLDLIAALDETRGSISRSTFILLTLERVLLRKKPQEIELVASGVSD